MLFLLGTARDAAAEHEQCTHPCCWATCMHCVLPYSGCRSHLQPIDPGQRGSLEHRVVPGHIVLDVVQHASL